ncbi:MAG: hypothetical protein K9J21_06950 [Bacteroidales bacterium]|nr:hypothetical protein [Bacteroidales bacterium]
MTKKTITAKEVTKQMIEDWKQTHGGVYLITTEQKKGYLRKPNRKDLSLASEIGEKDPMKFNEVILKNCWLAGDKEIMEDDRYFLAVSGQLDEIIETAEVEIKKL